MPSTTYFPDRGDNTDPVTEPVTWTIGDRFDKTDRPIDKPSLIRTVPITYGPTIAPTTTGADATTIMDFPVTIEAIDNPDFATMARLENYNSGRLYMTVFRDGELSSFGPVCQGVRNTRVSWDVRDKLCKALGFGGESMTKIKPSDAGEDMPPYVARGTTMDFDPHSNPMVFGDADNKGYLYATSKCNF